MSVILIGIYAIIFHKCFGIYSITAAVPRQDLFVCIDQEYYKSSNDSDFIELVEEGLKLYPNNKWSAMCHVLESYPLNEIQNFTNYCRKQCLPQYCNYILTLVKNYSSYNFDVSYYQILTQNIKYYCIFQPLFLFIKFVHAYIVILLELVLLIKSWIKDNKVPWIHCGLFGFTFVIIMSSFIGTCGEFVRTAICALPFTYIALAIYVNELSIKSKNEM